LSSDPEGEALIFRALFGTDKEAVEKRLFCALRFATRMPAAARKCYFSATYGTFSLHSPMAESHGLPSRALIQGFTHEDFFRNL